MEKINMIRLLLPDHFSANDCKTVAKTSPRLKVDRFQVTQRKSISPIAKGLVLLLNGKPCGDGSLDDVKICVAPTSLTREGAAYLVNRCPDLEWIHSTATGVEHLLTPEIKKRHILLSHSHLCSEAMAEYVLTVILCILKRTIEHSRLQQKGIWQFLPSQMLAGKRAGIVGLGHVGRAVARRLKQNGMEVWGLGRSERTQLPNVDRYITMDGLKTFVAECDFLIAALPVTDATYRCINAATIACMKKDAWLINIGRGELIDHQALLRALRDQEIGGACLDVIDDALQNKVHSLNKYPNLILTHHSSFSYPEYNDDNLKTFVGELKRYMAGQRPQNLVDMEKGY